MALPSQRLVNDDLFIINRITANDVDTYKVNADDIGVFLLEADRHPGNQPGDKYVNDGEINIYGKLQNLGDDVINLHSANEHCEGKLTFDEGFYITGNAMDVLVTLDYATLTNELTCDDGGLDGSTTCIKLDMTWLSDNIVCGDKGLEANGTCIGINLCDEHSGLTFRSSGCLEVNLCTNRAIVYHPVNGCLDVDLNWLTNQLSCDGLRPSGGDATSTCMEIDMGWLSDNIRCGSTGNPSAYAGSGLIDGGGCIRVDPCWVNDQLNTGNPQYLISDYDATSIDTTNCKLRVNEAWLLQWAKDNIQDIKVDGLCLEISPNVNLFKGPVEITLPEDCMDTWTREVIDDHLGVITKGSGCIGAISNGGDLTKGDVSISVDNTCIQKLIDDALDDLGDSEAPGAGTLELVGGSGITITQMDSSPNKFSANQKTGDSVKWKITGTGSGSSTDPTDACDDSLIFDSANNCLSVNFPDSCPAYERAVSGGNLYSRSSGSKLNPAVVVGTLDAADNGKAWAGIGSNVTNGSWTIYFSYKGWKNIDDCGGEPRETNKNNIRIISSVACGDNVLPHFANVGLIKNSNALNGEVQCFNYRGTDESGENQLWGGPPQGGGEYTRFSFRPRNNSYGLFPEMQAAQDTRTQIDIDTMIDELGTVSNGVERGVSSGIIRWNLKKTDETLPYPAMYIDSNELAQKYPALVDWTATDDVYEVVETLDSEGNFESYDHRVKPDEVKVENMMPGQLNETSILCAVLLANKRLKTRIDELVQQTSREGTLNTLGIVEYANETAAANSGLGQGEVYWDTTLNRMRAVT